jgi:hypothetical protein
MNWHEQRERLLADTIDFVQRATGESLVLAVKAKVPTSPEIELAARHFRRHHAGPKPTEIAAMRRELAMLFTACNDMQRSIRSHRIVTAPAA